MKFSHIWLFVAILKQCLSNITISQTQKFNYPLEISSSNTIYLRDYTLEIVEAPFYQLLSSSQYTLEINQAIYQLVQMNSSTINDSSIRIGSNYVTLSGVNSNNFWILTQDDMIYQGILESNGELQMTSLDMMMSQNYFQINLITNDFGMLSSLEEGQFCITLLNQTSLEQTDIVTNYSIQSQFYNPIVQILSANTTNLTFCLIYTTPNNAHIVYFTYNETDVELISEQIFDGIYQNAFLSENSNFLFLINSEHVYLVNLIENTGIQEIINQNVLNQNDLQPISYFATFQISNNLFHMVVLQQQMLTSFYIDINNINRKVQTMSYFLNEYQQILKLVVTFDNILIVTDTFIINLQLKKTIKATGYQLLKSGTYAFLYLLRNIVVVQESFNNQNTFSTYIINEPQIFISQYVSTQIEAMIMPIKLDILVASQINRKFIQYAFQIQLIQLDITENQMPIQFHQYIDDLVLRFPEEKVIDRSQIFLGPNLTLSLTSSNSNYLYAGTEGTKFGEYTISNARYSIACSFSTQQQIYCTQYTNDTIQLTIQNAAVSRQKYSIKTTKNLDKCSCFKTASNNYYVLMQFDQTVLIQQFNYSLDPTQQLTFPFQLNIISATILKDVLFATTIDGKLNAIDIQEQQQLFTISNYNFNMIYINQLDYPHYLFIDNLVELIILAYNGKQSYELINYIPYPIQNYNSSGIGILRNGIYFAFCKNQQNYIYFYQKINIFLQSSVSNYFSVYLEQYQIYTNPNPNIICSYTSNSFYLILYKKKQSFLTQFSGTGTSYTAIRTSKNTWISNLQTIELSSIVKQEPDYEVEIVYLFTNQAQSINHPYLSYDFMLATRYEENEYIGELLLYYRAYNQNFSSSFKQNVSIIYEANLLLPRKLHDKQTYYISDIGDIKINPRTLFYGNIQNYTANCNVCQSFNITQPIAYSTSYSVNISVFNIFNQNDLIYLTDKQNSLYQFYPETNQLQMIYNISHYGNQNCQYLFIEMQTSFPVQICIQNSTRIYAYNISSNELITHNLTEVCCFYTSSYDNGILTVFSNGRQQSIDYFAFYFWISNNTINLTQIFNSTGVCHSCFINPVYLSMSENFTTQPCQIFGFISTSNNGAGDNSISLLKNCISSTMSENFGFVPNTTTPSGNIYYTSSTWYLVETELVSFTFYYSTKQYGSSEIISDTIISGKFLVTYFNAVEVYNILFNQTTGQIINFVSDQNFFLSWNSTVAPYRVSQGSNGLLLIESFSENEVFTPQIFTYEQHKFEIKQNTKLINRMIGFVIMYIQPSQELTALSGNYYVFRNHTTTQLYYVQNYLTLSIDLTGIQNASIEITGYNPQNSITQSLFIQNINQNSSNNNETPTNNNTNDIPDNNNSTDSDDQKNQHRIILIVLYSLMIIFLLIVLIAPRCCCKKEKSQKNANSFNFELIEK